MDWINQAVQGTFLPTFLFWAGIGVIGLLIFPPTRPLLAYLMSQIFTPTGRGLLVIFFQWMVWAIKSVISAHKAYLRHLLTPRSTLFPTLEDSARRGERKPKRD